MDEKPYVSRKIKLFSRLQTNIGCPATKLKKLLLPKKLIKFFFSMQTMAI